MQHTWQRVQGRLWKYDWPCMHASTLCALRPLRALQAGWCVAARRVSPAAAAGDEQKTSVSYHMKPTSSVMPWRALRKARLGRARAGVRVDPLWSAQEPSDGPRVPASLPEAQATYHCVLCCLADGGRADGLVTYLSFVGLPAYAHHCLSRRHMAHAHAWRACSSARGRQRPAAPLESQLQAAADAARAALQQEPAVAPHATDAPALAPLGAAGPGPHPGPTPQPVPAPAAGPGGGPGANPQPMQAAAKRLGGGPGPIPLPAPAGPHRGGPNPEHPRAPPGAGADRPRCAHEDGELEEGEVDAPPRGPPPDPRAGAAAQGLARAGDPGAGPQQPDALAGFRSTGAMQQFFSPDRAPGGAARGRSSPGRRGRRGRGRGRGMQGRKSSTLSRNI